MAVFGAPVSLENDSLNACLCALEMQEKLREQRKKWAEEGKPELYARVGLNTGPMVVGNMGGETRFDYTVMGDSVNLGARLEPANKEYGTFIMMGEETYVRVKDKILARKLDLLRVKGKEEPVGVYQVVDVLEKAPEEVKQVVDLFASGYAAYLMQNWDKAENYFKLALNIDPEDGPSKTYVKRCQIFRENPPAEDWDGVFTMTTK
jgi:adenylate cyclase